MSRACPNEYGDHQIFSAEKGIFVKMRKIT
jgi:hypothetical protein